jgi:hypothetical protein
LSWSSAAKTADAPSKKKLIRTVRIIRGLLRISHQNKLNGRWQTQNNSAYGLISGAGHGNLPAPFTVETQDQRQKFILFFGVLYRPGG